LENARLNANKTLHEIEEELLKAQHSEVKNIRLKELTENLETCTVTSETYTTGRDMDVGTQSVAKFSELTSIGVTQLRDGKDGGLRIDRFIARMRQKAEEHGPGIPVFTSIGSLFGGILHIAPSHSYIKPCLNLGGEARLKQRVKYEQLVPRATKVEAVRGLTSEEAKAKTAEEDNSITRNLDNIRRILKHVWKINGAQPVSYYEFVLNPQDFGKSVENMFYISFLVRDGEVRIVLDENTGLPSLVHMTPQEKRQLQDRSGGDSKQAVTKLTYGMWKGLVDKLGIVQPMIKENAEEYADQESGHRRTTRGGRC